MVSVMPCSVLFGTCLLVFEAALLSASGEAPGTQLHSRFFSQLCGMQDFARASDKQGETACTDLAAMAGRGRAALDGMNGPAEVLDRLNHFFFAEERFQVTYDLTTSD